jgi:hypothetical protein
VASVVGLRPERERERRTRKSWGNQKRKGKEKIAFFRMHKRE